MIRLLHTCVLIASISFLSATAARADITLSEVGGGTLSKDTVITVSGNPGDTYLLVMGLTAGPTPLPAPHLPLVLDVDFTLINLSFTLPGFLGTIPASGEAHVALPFSFLQAWQWPLVDAITLHFQAVRHVSEQIVEKSNPCILTPNIPLTNEFTLNDMPIRRAGHLTTTLPDGRLVFIGGGQDGIVASYGETSIEVYDPCTQKFNVVGQLSTPRCEHSATLLKDGRILVVGGADAFPIGEPVNTAEVIDPANGFSTTPTANNLAKPRGLHRAEILPDGRVLVTGGTSSFSNPIDIISKSTDTTEIYDPTTNSFSAGPKTARPLVGHTMTRLADGRILLAGGYSFITIIFPLPFITDKAQIYTPSPSNPGSFGSSLTMQVERFAHTAVLADNGKVYIFGGATTNASDPLDPIATNTSEVFDPAGPSFQPFTTMSKARGFPAACLYSDGSIVVAGGAEGVLSAPGSVRRIEIFDPTTGAVPWSFDMIRQRANFSANLLPNGTVLLAGGGEEEVAGELLSWDDAEIMTLP